MASPRSPSAHLQLEDYMALLLGGAPTANAWPCEPSSRRHTSCAPATPTYGSPTHTRPASPADSPALGVATRPPGAGSASAASVPSQDEALACLLSRYPEADVDILMYFLSETSGNIEEAAGEYRRSKEAHDGSGGTADAPLPEPHASPPLAPTLPLPIPLTGARMHTPNSDEESASWESWPEAYLPAGDAMAISEGCAAPYDASLGCAGMAGADLAAAEMEGMELEESASYTYYAPHDVSASAPASVNGWGWQGILGGTSIPGAAMPSLWRPPPPPRRNDEAARRAASEAFVSAQQQVAALRDEAEACRTQAINKRRMNRPLEAAQLERRAVACFEKARYVQDRASREAYQRNNKDNVLEMKPIDLHGLTVGAAMIKTEEVLNLARMFVSQGIYSAVEVPLITGWGSHSSDGVPKIRTAVRCYLEAHGVGYRLENAGGRVVACLA